MLLGDQSCADLSLLDLSLCRSGLGRCKEIECFAGILDAMQNIDALDLRELKLTTQAAKKACLGFLSILSIKPGNWFYWADRAETAERAEIKESPLFMLL
jgi:hypothetical protein